MRTESWRLHEAHAGSPKARRTPMLAITPLAAVGVITD